jgi:predicted deacylase
MGLNIPSVTVEIGDPSRFHLRFIKSALLGVENILGFLNMYPFPNVPHEVLPVLCSHSKWIYAGRGGVLYVHPDINVWVRQGELIAEVTDIFGNIIEHIFADEDAVVVGKSVNPVCQSGDRVIHLGYVSSTEFSILTRDGHE